MASLLIESRRRIRLIILIVIGWVNAFVNLLISAAFLILTPPYGGQENLLRLIGVMMLALAAVQILINIGLARREEWARKATRAIAFIEFFQPPFGTAHAVLTFITLRRSPVLRWFV